VVVVRRRVRSDLQAQVADLRRIVDELGPAAVVGIDGGGTVALALAMGGPPGLGTVVVHEPLVGPLAPALHAAACEMRDRLLHEEGYGGAGFVAELAGVRTWNRIDPRHRAEIALLGPDITADIVRLCEFAPTRPELAAARAARLVVSHGRRSGVARRSPSLVLARHAGASVVQISECGHLPQLDNPAGLAAVVRDSAQVVPEALPASWAKPDSTSSTTPCSSGTASQSALKPQNRPSS
jgi:pimeloyl-ACP methyl ester carboxylesterase